MTEENTEAVETTEEKATSTRITQPKTPDDVSALTHLPTSEATTSFNKFLNERLANTDNWQPTTDEQAWAMISCYRAWQSSPERKAEIASVREEEAAKKEAAKEERKAKAEQRKLENEAKAEERKRKAEEKAAAKAAAKADSDDDLDSVDSEGEGEISSAPKKRRKRPVPTTDEEAGTPETVDPEPAEAGAL